MSRINLVILSRKRKTREEQAYCRNRNSKAHYRSQTPISYAKVCHEATLLGKRLLPFCGAHKIIRSSPTRRVIRSRSRYSSSGIAYFLDTPVKSLKRVISILEEVFF